MDESLRERDGQIAENWYVACLSRELGKVPLSRVIYDKPYVLFRDAQGLACVLPDRCLHRHALLSEGQIVRGELTCPYHGWRYDSVGTVTRIPSEGPNLQKLAARPLCLPALPCLERDGVVWVWMGRKEHATTEPPWRFPHYGEAGWSRYFMITDFDNEVTNLAENFMDVPHTTFVHRGWFRDPKPEDRSLPNTMTVETKQGSVLVTYHQKKDEFSWFARLVLNPAGAEMVHTDRFIYPNLTRVDYRFGANSHFIINSQITPVGALKSRVYTFITFKLRRPFGALLKPVIRFYTRRVIEQDVRIMRNQGRSLSWDPKTTFHSTDADEVHKAIERLRRWGSKGDEQLLRFETEKDTTFWT